MVWILITLVTTWVTLFIFTLMPPNFSTIDSQKIASESINVLPHEGSGPFRRQRADETAYDLNSAPQIPKKIRRQYTYKFELNEPPVANGEVFVPLIGGEGVIYVNGVRIDDVKNRTSYIPGFSRRYIYASIPASTYQTGINRLIIVMTPDNSYAGLPAIYMGQNGDFFQAAKSINSRSIIFLNIVSTCGLILIFLSILGLFQRPKFGLYLPLLGVGGSAAMLALLGKFSSNLALSEPNGWAAGIYSLMGLSLALLYVNSPFKHRPIYLGLWLAAILSVVLALTKFLPIEWPFYISSFSYFCAGGALPFGLAYGLQSLFQDRQFAKISEAELQEKLAKQEGIIAAQEKAIEDGLKAKGRLEERQRLTRDIHDGIGGQLLSLLVRVRDGDMKQADIENDLQYGLNDLRLIVDSMDHSEGTLDAAFVTFRARAHAQLRAANIALKWTQSDPFVPTYLGPAAILNVYRLMQEAVTNTIRHAQCDELVITVIRESEVQDLVISLADNGIGFRANSQFKAGQGVKNMRYRAKALGGALIISGKENGGTEIRLSIPLKLAETGVN